MNLVKITFELDPSAWHGSATERLWAEPVATNRYRLLNTPFYAFGVSFEDIVIADEIDGELIFKQVSIFAGHSTYRIFLLKNDKVLFNKYWLPLQELGCTYEEGTVLAVDVPPQTDLNVVYRLLENGFKDGVWDFQEGHCGHNNCKK